MTTDTAVPLPEQFRTDRLLLRRWRAADAAALAPVLEANVAHLAPWIPWRVAEPVPPPELAARLAGFAEGFDAGREWRYGLFLPDGATPLGELSLFPRSAAGRVPLAEADRVEIGYWLRADMTGRGLVTEAVRAALDLAAMLPGMRSVEIRCDARNAPSAAVPRRLGFELTETLAEPPVAPGAGAAPIELQVWTRPLA